MRRRLPCALVGLVTFVTLLSQPARAGEGEGGLAATLAAASDRGVPAVVRVHAAWCAPCARLEAEVFAADAAEGRFAGVALGTVDFDSDAGEAVTERYRVLNLPTVLVLDGDGREVGRVEGYEGRKWFLERLDEVLEGDERSVDALRAVTIANPERAPAWFALGRRLLLRGDPVEARAALDRAILADPAGAQGVAAKAYDLLGRYFVRTRTDYDEGVAVLGEARVRVAGTDAIPNLLWWYATACMRQGDIDGAEMALHRYSAAHPYDVLPFLLRADFFEQHDRDVEQIERDLGVIRSLKPAPDILAAAWHVQARLRKKQGRVDEARAAIEKAIALMPDEALYRRFREGLGEREGTE